MVCITRRPRCGTAESASVPQPLTQLVALATAIGTVISTILGLVKAAGAITVSGGTIAVGGFAIGGATLGGALAGLAAAIAMVTVVAVYANDRCNETSGSSECVAGVVVAAKASFSSGWDEVFPFSAMHDRIDVVAKSIYWDVIETGLAFVFCTAEDRPRRSEIMRCYFFDSQVCAAAQGAVTGAIIGAVAGIIAAALIAAAIGCATVVFCLIALLVALVVAAAAVLIGALIGGQAAKASTSSTAPSTGSSGSGTTLAVGDLVTVKGNMVRRDYDDKANVFYWVDTVDLHGNSVSPQPFSYCEIDDELPVDAC